MVVDFAGCPVHQAGHHDLWSYRRRRSRPMICSSAMSGGIFDADDGNGYQSCGRAGRLGRYAGDKRRLVFAQLLGRPAGAKAATCASNTTATKSAPVPPGPSSSRTMNPIFSMCRIRIRTSKRRMAKADNGDIITLAPGDLQRSGQYQHQLRRQEYPDPFHQSGRSRYRGSNHYRLPEFRPGICL